MRAVKRLLSVALCLGILNASLITPAQARLITTEEFARMASRQEGETGHDRLSQALQRDDVQAALKQQGVGDAAAQARIAALSDEEAGRLADQIQSAPAGGIIGEIVFVFFVLLITDILGFTKVYPFTRPAR